MTAPHASPAILEFQIAELRKENAALKLALKESADCLIWAAQESTGRVKKEIVGGWIHHSNKARAAIQVQP